MTASPSREKQLTMTILASPEMVNFSGKVHGGAMLRCLDQVAYACASRYSGSTPGDAGAASIRSIEAALQAESPLDWGKVVHPSDLALLFCAV